MTQALNTEADWDLGVTLYAKDPSTGTRTPQDVTGWDIEAGFALPDGTEVAQASTSDDTITIVDAAAGKIAISVPLSKRTVLTLKRQSFALADIYRVVADGRKWLGRVSLMLVEGA